MGVSITALYGLSGLGDLALTCYSLKSSHNKNFGLKIGQGMSIQQILDSMAGTIAEGYFTTKAVYELSQKHKIDLPLCSMIYMVLYENKSIQAGFQEIMNRPLKVED